MNKENELLKQIEKDSLELKKVQILKKSRFYNLDYLCRSVIKTDIREHIGTYKDQAIMLREENEEMKVSLIPLKNLRELRKINGNLVRKIQPKSIDNNSKILLMLEVIKDLREKNND